MQDQHAIRKHIQSLRQTLSNEQQQSYSQQICQQLLSSKLLKDAKHIAIYLPVRGEADPTLMLCKQGADKQFYLPVLSPTQKNHLAFAKYDQKTPMKLNRFKIPEPNVDDSELLNNPEKLDCVVMPLVGIDPKGNRIGMGGGFYDRTFAFRKGIKSKPFLIGFCYDFQMIAEQIPQAWDVPADAIVTQSNIKLL